MATSISSSASSRRKGRSPLWPERPATVYALLGLLIDGPSHGYDLTRHFSAQSELGRVCRLEMSMLYGLLKKLEREGLISGHDEPVSDNKSRRVVELTERGRQEFENWLHKPVEHTRELRFSFLVKLYFARQRSTALALKLFEDQIELNQALLEQLNQQKQVLADPNQPEDHRFSQWVIDFRLEQTSAALQWLNRCRNELLASP